MNTVAAPEARRDAWRKVRRLLAVRLDNLGDLLMTTPALAALRETLPDAHITLLGSSAVACARPHLAMVDSAISFDAPWVRHAELPAQLELPGQAEAALLRQLTQMRYDAVVIFTTSTQSPLPMAMLARQAGIPLRLAHCRENPYALLSDWVPETDTLSAHMRHEVRRQLDLVAHIDARTADERLRFRLLPLDQKHAEALLHKAGLSGRRSYVVVHPGASAASRRWPPARFGAAADLIAANSGCQIVFCGTQGEAELIAEARAAMNGPSISLDGALSLGEFAAVLDGASLILCNNSAPAHLAAALGTPIVELYALTNPQHTPWRVPSRVLNHNVPCRWCLKSTCPERHNDCLRRIHPARAAEAAVQLLRAPRRLPDDSSQLEGLVA